MVAYSILFSLFKRAYLMFHHQAETFQLRQWSGWKHFLNDFIRRENVRTAWQLSKGTYDTDFQRFMDEKIAAIQAPPPPPPTFPREPVPVGEHPGSCGRRRPPPRDRSPRVRPRH